MHRAREQGSAQSALFHEHHRGAGESCWYLSCGWAYWKVAYNGPLVTLGATLSYAPPPHDRLAFEKSEQGRLAGDLRGLPVLSQVWVDSDGKVAYNGAHVAGLSDPWGNSQEGPPSEGALMDHQWHMLTVSTQPNGVNGYR